MLIFFGVGGVLYTWVLITYLPQTTSPITAFTADGGRLRHPHRLHLGQRDRQGGGLPGPHPRARRRAGLRAGQLDVRRHRSADLPGAQGGRQRHWFIVYVTVVIAVSLVVYIFFLRNRAVTALDREQGHAYEFATGRRG